MTDLFASKVAVYGPRLMTDLTLTAEQAAGVFGNVGHECMGFKALQEIKPAVAGSRGGYGWMQWTGPRRRAYEAWCKTGDRDPASDDANYLYLVRETAGAEIASLLALRRTKTVQDAADTFCLRNLRPGIAHLDSRRAYAKRALDVIAAAAAPEVIQTVLAGTPVTVVVQPSAISAPSVQIVQPVAVPIPVVPAIPLPPRAPTWAEWFRSLLPTRKA